MSAYASNHGLGAVLLQEEANGYIKPVSYISSSQSPPEERYAHIEKETLAFTWESEHFQTFWLVKKSVLKQNTKH